MSSPRRKAGNLRPDRTNRGDDRGTAHGAGRPVAIAAGSLALLAFAYVLWRRETGGRCAQPRRIESRWTRVRGLRVHSLASTDPVRADRPPVVLVHGLGMSSRYMAPLARCLPPHFRVHAPDLPGFGLSDKPKRFLRVGALAGALAAWMDRTGIDRAAFVGNSLGCEILVEFALRYPERVVSLVLQGPTPDPHHAAPLRQIGWFAVTGLFERPSLGWVALSDYLRSGVGRYIATFHDMNANRMEGKLPYVRAPTLVVWGTRDYLVPRRSVEAMAALLPAGRLVVVGGAAHGMNYSHPSALRDCIVPFLLGQEFSRGVGGPHQGAVLDRS